MAEGDQHPTGEPGAALRRLAGNIIFAVGALWTLLSGACTLVALAIALPDNLKNSHQLDLVGLLAIVLIPGVISTVVGLGIIAGGRALAGRGKDGKVDHSTFD